MKIELTRPKNPSKPFTMGRREFLESALGTGFATTLSSGAQKARKITANAQLRIGLIGRNGHTEILLGSIPRLQNVQWTAYAKGEAGEIKTWVQKFRTNSLHAL